MIVEKLTNDHPERSCDYKAFTYDNRYSLKKKPANSVSLLVQALYNEYVHFKETEIPVKEMEKGHVAHLYKLLEVKMNMSESEGEQRKR